MLNNISRQQASDLFVALNKLESGLAAGNAITAADNINALRPAVESLDKGKLAAQRQLRALKPDHTREAAAQAIMDDLEMRSADPINLDLFPMDITADEITAVKIAPRDLATLRQFLLPAKK